MKLSTENTNAYKVGFYDAMYSKLSFLKLCRYRVPAKKEAYEAGYKAGRENKQWKRM